MNESMRLFLDQMFKVDLLERLRAEGFDVLRTVDTGYSRASDDEILRFAVDQKRTLITLDEHFGNWVVLQLSYHSGVIRLKVHPPLTETIAGRLIPFLQHNEQSSFLNHLIILETNRERWIRTVP